jgi:lysophospholipase L1-like esterase
MFNWVYFVLFALLCVIVVLSLTGWWRFTLTGYLIARVTPYEQVGGGAGSILFIGDSTGYGTGASQSKESIAGRLGAEYSRYTITNNSVNGRKIAGAMRVAHNQTASARYDLVVLQIAANDLLGGTSATETVARMEELIVSVRPFTEHIVIITSGNVGGVPLFSGDEAKKLTNTSRTYNQRMTELASEYQTVSFVALFDEPADDVFLQSPEIYTSIDGLHPTSAGYAVWYTKAKPYFAAVLEQR